MNKYERDFFALKQIVSFVKQGRSHGPDATQRLAESCDSKRKTKQNKIRISKHAHKRQKRELCEMIDLTAKLANKPKSIATIRVARD